MHARRHALFALAFAANSLGCRASNTASGPPRGSIELTQSVPSETPIAMTGYRATDDAWLSLINGARQRLDLAFFYACDAPPSRLTPIVEAIIAAKRRGVWVSVVLEHVFIEQYPDIRRQLHNAGIAIRIVDRSKTTGGIVHAKMMAADGQRAWVGSANFDWRSLDHIHELGVLVTSPDLAEAVHRLIAYDVELGDAATPASGVTVESAATLSYVPLTSAFGPAEVAFGASQKGWLPREIVWDWPHLDALIASAKSDLTVEFMSYGVLMRDGREWRELDNALRGAVGRGVRVSLVLANWAEQGKHGADLHSLAEAGVHVRIVTIPDASTGPIPFARVIHGKTVIADGARCWVGTSNGEGDYFLKSRNAGFFLRSEGLCAQLRATVEGLGQGPFAAPLRSIERPSP